MAWRRIIATITALALASCIVPRPFVSIRPEPANSAWWLRAEYRPFGTTIRGVPVRDIDRSWCAANEFRERSFPAGRLTGRASLEKTQTSFSLSLRPAPGRDITALVGAYHTCGERHGTFLLILDESQPAAPKVMAVYEWDEPFAVLHPLSDQAFEVWWCFECDHIGTLEWDASTGAFRWKAPIDHQTGK